MRKLYDRFGTSIWQFVRFGVVGGLGVVVNLLVVIILKRELSLFWASAAYDGVWASIPFTDFNVRWYHVMSTIAFFVANLFNFQLNRWWTFNSAKHAPWLKEYWPFLSVGLIAQVVGLGILTLLMWHSSPIALPSSVFDDSSGFRTKFYWAQLIMIMFTVPLSFLLNKFWTFRAVRQKRLEVEVEEAEGVDEDPCTSSN